MADPYILLISADRHLAEEVSYSFPQGFDVKVAVDTREAWSFMDAEAPTVAIVEIRSGNSGGFSLAREMSQREVLESVPILMLLERPQDAWLAEQAGAASMRIQPVEASELVAAALDLVPAPA